MKVMDHCHECLRGLAEKAVGLSHGSNHILSQAYVIIDELWNENRTPPEVANKVLRFIRSTTGIYDPYLPLKKKEVEKAQEALGSLRAGFPKTLEGYIRLSALGNSMDFFCNNGYTAEGFDFGGDIDNIEKEIYTNNDTVLILADNVGEFLFDLELVRYLEVLGKTVHYAVKEHPVQNDLSIPDVKRFGFDTMFSNIISTGTDEVGMRRECLQGRVKALWDSDGIIIAKGMGNYETISEFFHERPVIHIMKVKCPAVARAVGKQVGQYTAMIGGGQYGYEKRLL